MLERELAVEEGSIFGVWLAHLPEFVFLCKGLPARILRSQDHPHVQIAGAYAKASAVYRPVGVRFSKLLSQRLQGHVFE